MQKPPGQYAPPEGAESETEPGLRGLVLRNRLGVARKRERDQREFEALLRMQHGALRALTAQTRFTAKTICKLRRDWLGEIYDWAGTYRTVEMSKAGFQWPRRFASGRTWRISRQGFCENSPRAALRRWRRQPCRSRKSTQNFC